MRRLAHARWINNRCYHIETELAVVNVYVGLHDLKGHKIESVEIIPDKEGQTKGATIDGKDYLRVRIIENKERN